MKAASPWHEVPIEEWNDLRWQLRHLIRTPEQLTELLDLPAHETAAIRDIQSQFRFAISPYYFSLIDRDNPSDPIRRMIVPSSREADGGGSDDPLSEKDDQVAPGLSHRYPDRVLFVVTSFCSSYCRFCIRKRNWKNSDAASTRAQVDEAIAYLRAHEEVRDVLLSGGDPLTLPLDQLDYILQQIRSVRHVEFVRMGSREPVMLPMRIAGDLLRVLDRNGSPWINTHFNHPREITEESAQACEKLARLGIPLNNQTVLLAGVNDDAATITELFRRLLSIRVRPYYLYHCDPVVGASHFRTSIWKGVELIEALRGHTTGLAVPTFVVDAPGGAGKIPLMPNYLISAAPGRVVLRNFEGVILGYSDQASDSASNDAHSHSVADLAHRAGPPLIPHGQQHYQRRDGLVQLPTRVAGSTE
jgi:lysine 2,3-aminomutase